MTTPENQPSGSDRPEGQPPQAPPTPSSYAPPISGSIPPALGHPAPPSASDTVPYNPPNGYGSPSAPSAAGAQAGAQAPARPARRGASVGIIAALAVGALVGGASGAGVSALVMNGSRSGVPSAIGAAPANITVNDSSRATTITAVAASAGPSVVTISVSDGSTGSAGTGSGVILSADGYVLTNAHVVTLDGATASPTVSVQTSDGGLYSAKIVGTDPIVDLAVIKIEGATNLRAAAFGDSSKLNVGDTAVAIGAPLGLANTVTNGIVSSLNRSITVASSAAPSVPNEQAPNGQNAPGPFDFWRFGTPGQPQAPSAGSSTIALSVIQTDAAINPGNSGGALFDANGKVIGINVAIASAGSGARTSQSGSIGVGFAIPSNLAKRIADELIATGVGSHGLLGAAVADVAAGSSKVVGASIQSISPGGAAESAGLKSGDVVTSINGVPVTGKTDLTAQVRALAGGAAAKLTYVRNGTAATATVTLGTLK